MSRGSRFATVTPDSNNAAESWDRVDPDIRTLTWTQSCDVTSKNDGSFSCDIVFKERDPSFQKPLTGGYSLTRPRVLKLQWHTNGQFSGIFKRYYTFGTSNHDGSFFVDETPSGRDWRRVFKGFPKIDSDASGTQGVYRIWGYGAPANTYLGSMIATITVVDKCKRR